MNIVCRTTINVTFFNEFGDYFLQSYETIQQKPVIIVIASGKVSEWNGIELFNLTVLH